MRSPYNSRHNSPSILPASLLSVGTIRIPNSYFPNKNPRLGHLAPDSSVYD